MVSGKVITLAVSAILNAGGEVPVAAIEELAWEQVAAAYGYELDDAGERRHVDLLVQGIFTQLADLGAAECMDRGVRAHRAGTRAGRRVAALRDRSLIAISAKN